MINTESDNVVYAKNVRVILRRIVGYSTLDGHQYPWVVPQMKNKKQHFLPAGFLKNFSDNPEAGRSANVHVFDGNQTFSSSVGSICAEGDYYGPKREQEFLVHGELEPGLFQTLEKVSSGDRTEKSLFSMMFHVSYLHVRGPEFENESGKDRLDAVQHQGVVHLCQHVLGMDSESVERNYGPELARQAFETAKDEWDIHILTPSSDCSDETLVCSDCPALFFTDENNATLIVMPLSTNTLFVAAKKSAYRLVSSEYRTEDAAWGNGAQCWFAFRHIIANKPFTNNEQTRMAAIMKKGPERRACFEGNDLVIPRKELGENLPSFVKPAKN